MRYRKDLTGMRIGQLTVINLSNHRDKHKKPVWDCVCECGNTKSIAQGYLLSGIAKNCGCERKPIEKKYSPKESTFRDLYYKRIISRNKQKGFIEGSLSFERYYELSLSKCRYCGLESSNRISDKSIKGIFYEFNGIDRFDSSVGYTNENSVTCCKHCNYAKNTMTESQFFNWIKRVHHYNNFHLDKTVECAIH